MADLNKTFLMGRLTKDVDLRRTSAGKAVAELNLATKKTWYGKDGEKREDTLFVGVTVWDKTAENCAQYLSKGSSVHIEGSLKMDQWDDKKTGEKRSKISVNAENVQFLDSKPRTERSDYSPPSPTSPRQEPRPVETARSAMVAGADGGNEDDPDDIPF